MDRYETTINWIYAQRTQGKTEEQIRASLTESNWKPEEIEKVMSAPKPQEKKQLNFIKIMYWVIGLFSLLVTLLILLGYGVIGDKTIAFTPEACLADEAIPDSACEALASIVAGESEANWNNGPSTLTTGEIAQGFDTVLFDLNTWTKSLLPNIDSATICAVDGEDLWLLVLSDNGVRWGVDSIIDLDENGKNTNFGDVSYCNSHL